MRPMTKYNMHITLARCVSIPCQHCPHYAAPRHHYNSTVSLHAVFFKQSILIRSWLQAAANHGNEDPLNLGLRQFSLAILELIYFAQFRCFLSIYIWLALLIWNFDVYEGINALKYCNYFLPHCTLKETFYRCYLRCLSFWIYPFFSPLTDRYYVFNECKLFAEPSKSS